MTILIKRHRGYSYGGVSGKNYSPLVRIRTLSLWGLSTKMCAELWMHAKVSKLTRELTHSDFFRLLSPSERCWVFWGFRVWMIRTEWNFGKPERARLSRILLSLSSGKLPKQEIWFVKEYEWVPLTMSTYVGTLSKLFCSPPFRRLSWPLLCSMALNTIKWCHWLLTHSKEEEF